MSKGNLTKCNQCRKLFVKTSRDRRLCDNCTQSNPFDVRFWNRVKKTRTCWLWMGSTNKGYGQVNVNGKPTGAHRVAWELVRGEIPEGLLVCHDCDNPRCCNPKHLFLGTDADNIRDMDRKGRRINSPQLGEKHGMHILTEKQARMVRDRARRGENRKTLAKEFGIKPITVYAIKIGRLWKCLDR